MRSGVFMINSYRSGWLLSSVDDDVVVDADVVRVVDKVVPAETVVLAETGVADDMVDIVVVADTDEVTAVDAPVDAPVPTPAPVPALVPAEDDTVLFSLTPKSGTVEYGNVVVNRLSPSSNIPALITFYTTTATMLYYFRFHSPNPISCIDTGMIHDSSSRMYTSSMTLP